MTSPLDLSSPGGFAPRKRQRPETRRSESVSPKPKPVARPTTPPPVRCPTLYGHIPCGDGQAVNRWTIEDVVNYVSSIDICAEYAQVSQGDFSYCDAVLREGKSMHLRNCSCTRSSASNFNTFMKAQDYTMIFYCHWSQTFFYSFFRDNLIRNRFL